MNHHEPKKTCGRWEIEVQVSDNAKATRLIARDGQSSKTSFTHELKHFDQSNHYQVTWGCERSSRDLCGRSKRNSDKHGQTWTYRDGSTNKHQLIASRKAIKATATLTHTDAWADSRCHHPTPSWHHILNHTPQTCFQHPALPGCGALRSGQGRLDVRRDIGYLMGIWERMKFGMPNTHHLQY